MTCPSFKACAVALVRNMMGKRSGVGHHHTNTTSHPRPTMCLVSCLWPPPSRSWPSNYPTNLVLPKQMCILASLCAGSWEKNEKQTPVLKLLKLAVSVIFVHHKLSIPKVAVSLSCDLYAPPWGPSDMWVDRKGGDRQYVRESAIEVVTKIDSTRKNTVFSEDKRLPVTVQWLLVLGKVTLDMFREWQDPFHLKAIENSTINFVSQLFLPKVLGAGALICALTVIECHRSWTRIGFTR